MLPASLLPRQDAGPHIGAPVTRFRDKMILLFVLATLLPLAGTFWLGLRLLRYSVELSAQGQLQNVTDQLERTARLLYQREREVLRAAVSRREIPATISSSPDLLAELDGEPERFLLRQSDNALLLLRPHPQGVEIFTRPLGDLRFDQIAESNRNARTLLDRAHALDLGRGFSWTFITLSAGLWLVALIALLLLTNRAVAPIEQLSAAMARVANGEEGVRMQGKGHDEVGRAVSAFNRMTEELEQRQTRVLYLTQIASWQMLARKMAHELKNSLTPIRLTVEEMLARSREQDRDFTRTATSIVVGEVESLERRLRAFSDFAAEPAVLRTTFDIVDLLRARIQLVQPSLPAVRFHQDPMPATPVHADCDLVSGILTNLLKNAGEAMQARGSVYCRILPQADEVWIEVEDSGPGMPPERREHLFQPSISHKQGGMGLGLSIAKRNALLSGGDLELVDTSKGACFRLRLKREAA